VTFGNKDTEMDAQQFFEEWEKELFVPVRICEDDTLNQAEHARLLPLWQAAQPLSESQKKLIGYIQAIRECNWRLETAVWDLLRAIGTEGTTGLLHGHGASITEDRWKKMWAYYLTLRNWLSKPCYGPVGYAILLKMCDPSGEVQQRIVSMLGERTELKEFYVERLCLWFDWTAVGGMFDDHSAMGTAHTGAVAAVEQKIKELNPDGGILPWIAEDGQGHTEPCHHKAFRRYDIIISSIGAGKWRAVIPERKTDGLDLIRMHDSFIGVIETWLSDRQGIGEDKEENISVRVHELLGEKTSAKVFLSSFLCSLLRLQRHRVQKHLEKRGIKQ